MGYVSGIVQSGITLADRAQIKQNVEKYVAVASVMKKARSFERLGQLIDLAEQHVSLEAVKQLDEKVDRVLDGVSDRKAKAVEFVQQKKGDVLEHCSGAKELLDKQKAAALGHYTGAVEFVQQKKGDVIELVQKNKGEVLGLVQKNKGEVLEYVQQKTDRVQSLAQERLPLSAQERLAHVWVQVGLLTTVLAVYYQSLLDAPRSFQQRLEASFPQLATLAAERWAEVKAMGAARFETAKAFGKAAYADPAAQARKLREMAEPVKSMASARLEAAKEAVEARFEAAKAFGKAAYADPAAQARKLREMAEAQYAALAKSEHLRRLELPSLEQARLAAHGALAWAQTSVPAEPVVTKPVVTKPVVTKPVVTKPVVTKPVVTKPVVTKSVVIEPVVTEPWTVPVPAVSAVDVAALEVSAEQVKPGLGLAEPVATTRSRAKRNRNGKGRDNLVSSEAQQEW